MSWWTWVLEVSGTESPKEMQAKTGIDGPNFSKWKAGQIPRAETVAKFARGYQVPVLSAFVAAGFLTEKEARMRPAASPSLSSLNEVDLIKEVLRRAEERGERGGDDTPAIALAAARRAGMTRDEREEEAARAAAQAERAAADQAHREAERPAHPEDEDSRGTA